MWPDRSLIEKRSIVVDGRKTSVSLESEFFFALKEIAGQRKMKLGVLVTLINSERAAGNFSSAIRLFVLDEARKGNLAPQRT